MRQVFRWLVPAVLMLMGAAPPVPTGKDMVVHEWGTFLAMSGSDGVSLDGMYHEEHPLPHFVHSRARDQLHPRSIFLKGETPVIYFYTPNEARVRVEVKFPRGLWTQWFPAAAGVWPALAATPTGDAPQAGRIVWLAKVIPPSAKDETLALPATSADALWNYARDVDAAFVQTGGPKGIETERYLFYRGLGTVPLPIKMTSQAGGTLTSTIDGQTDVKHVFVLRVENGKGAFAYRPTLGVGEDIKGIIPDMAKALPLEEFAKAVGDELVKRLVESGLYLKEARAMVNTWKQSYFKTEGTRALFVLPQRWTDEFIPMTITPKPKELVRVMVGRLEMLTPEREQLAEKAVQDLMGKDPGCRSEAFDYLKAQGRYVEPILRRVLKTTKDESIKKLCQRLLTAEFVTELRTSLQCGPEERQLTSEEVWSEEPAHVRAQLASLLRDVGLNTEARAEGYAALHALSKKVIISLNPETCDDHRYAKAMARALEGTGDDQRAAEHYGRVIELGVVAARTKDCRTCHQQLGAATDIGMREWWAGERFAAALTRSGGLQGAIVKAEKDSASQQLAADLKLVYLYAASGRVSKPKIERNSRNDTGKSAMNVSPDKPRPSGS
ncbi:hypothetical protein [Singulisphaera sp. PoT]|uniref:hypothetical protein n=1 Tax=Singulisphaera sp. PoT TaxID=3411797 RepID=UPI003BF61412